MGADVSIVVESFTHGEGSSLERVSLALDAATRMVEELSRGEVLVADASADPALCARARCFGWACSPRRSSTRALVNDLRRLAVGRRDLGLRAWQVPFAVLLLPIYRLVDLAGIVGPSLPAAAEPPWA